MIRSYLVSFVAAALLVGVGCGSTETVEQDEDVAPIEQAAPVEESAPPNPAEPVPVAPPEDAGGPPPLEPELANAAPAWWQDEPLITDERVLVYATVDSATYFDAREKAIDAAVAMLEGEHNAEPLPAEIVFSADQLDNGDFRVWVRMAGKR